MCPTWATSNHFELNGLDRPLKLPQNSSIFWANTIKNEKTKEAAEEEQGENDDEEIFGLVPSITITSGGLKSGAMLFKTSV